MTKVLLSVFRQLKDDKPFLINLQVFHKIIEKKPFRLILAKKNLCQVLVCRQKTITIIVLKIYA
jgi:hypothetical protein